uniref:Ribonuclease PIN domain-containing protein n=1 Tax=Serinus canaria TaxID=9135 RepID=A0A8C9N0V3_SERCA
MPRARTTTPAVLPAALRRWPGWAMGHADMARVPHVVADTGAFLSAAPLQDIADALYTVPEVLAEIRDRPTRRRLAALPCELRVRRPRPELLRIGECRAGPATG